MKPIEPMQPMKPMFDRKSGAAPRWWPESLGADPSSAGSADGKRYAYFAASDRLAIQQGDTTAIYDTAGHEIQGVSQSGSALVVQDAAGNTLTLNRFKQLKN